MQNRLSQSIHGYVFAVSARILLGMLVEAINAGKARPWAM